MEKRPANQLRCISKTCFPSPSEMAEHFFLMKYSAWINNIRLLISVRRWMKVKKRLFSDSVLGNCWMQFQYFGRKTLRCQGAGARFAPTSLSWLERSAPKQLLSGAGELLICATHDSWCNDAPMYTGYKTSVQFYPFVNCVSHELWKQERVGDNSSFFRWLPKNAAVINFRHDKIMICTSYDIYHLTLWIQKPSFFGVSKSQNLSFHFPHMSWLMACAAMQPGHNSHHGNGQMPQRHVGFFANWWDGSQNSWGFTRHCG